MLSSVIAMNEMRRKDFAQRSNARLQKIKKQFYPPLDAEHKIKQLVESYSFFFG
jgi:hypothetical protein